MPLIILITCLSSFSFGKNLYNFSTAFSGNLRSGRQNLETVDKQFNYSTGYKNERFDSSYQICNELCYSVGLGYWHQHFVLSKYLATNPAYLSFQFESEYIYSTFRIARLNSSNLETGLSFNLGNETLKAVPYEGVSTQSATSSYAVMELSPYLRYSFLSFPEFEIESVYFEFGGQMISKFNSEMNLDNEKISASSSRGITLLLYLGLGLSF